MGRPNVLLLYTDQQRWDALGANGNSEIQTPHLDQLARDGVNFDHCCIQNPVCMPSRVSFLSGQYPATLRITHMGVPVPAETQTLPRLLRTYGYRSANIGKLHFLPHANRDHREPHPDYGFDHLEISDEPGVYEDAYRAWVRRHYPNQMEHLSVGLPPATAIWNETMGVDDPVHHPAGGGRFDFKGATPFPGDDSVTHSAFVAERTIDFLRRQRGEQPFMCIAGFYSPHAPWVVPQTYLDLYDPQALTLPSYPPELTRAQPQVADDVLRSARHGYYAMVSEVDHHVGRILGVLSERGLDEETIVIFTSDHGEWLGEHLRYGKGYPAHDMVSRVPLMIRAPGMKRNRTVHSLVESLDVLPTVLDLAGIQIPASLQGESMLPALRGAEFAGKEITLMEANGWKMARSDRSRYIIHADGRESLFDLTREFGEYRDVADQDAYVDELHAMRYRLLQRLTAIERPLPRAWTY